MACVGVFIGLVFHRVIRLRAIHFAVLAAIMLLPCVSFLILNPDSYQHFMVSTLNLNDPHTVLTVDSGTIGPLVPALISVLRLLGPRELVEPQAVSEFLQLVFYALLVLFLALCWASMKPPKGRRMAVGSVLGAASLVGILTSSNWLHYDFHSYNGEIVAIAVLAALSLLAFRPVSPLQTVLRALLVVLVTYVKAQALPAAILLLLIRNRKVGLRGSTVNERVLLLAASVGVFLLIESGIVLLHGNPFLSKLPLLFRFVYPQEVAKLSPSPDFADFLPLQVPGTMPLQTLPWALSQLSLHMPGVFASLAIFVCLTVVSKRFRFGGVIYLKVAAAYLIVAFFSIALSGNRFEHYLLLSLPVVGLLARGFSVAGGKIFLRPSAAMAAFFLILSVAEVAVAYRGYRFAHSDLILRPGESSPVPWRRVPYELISFLREQKLAGGEFYVHGFDSELYVYTNSPRIPYNLGFMLLKTRRIEDFCDYAFNLHSLGPRFIVDAVEGKWGVVVQEGLTLAANPSFRGLILDNYRLKGRYSDIPVYERFDNAPLNTTNTACARSAAALH